MFTISDNDIELTRGDTAIMKFELYDTQGNLVDLSDFEGKLVFTVWNLAIQKNLAMASSCMTYSFDFRTDIRTP